MERQEAYLYPTIFEMKKNLLLVQLSVSVKSSQTYLPPNDSFGYQMNNLFAPKRDGRFIVSILTFQPITTTISTYVRAEVHCR